MMNVLKSLYQERNLDNSKHDLLDDFKSQVRSEYYCEECSCHTVETSPSSYIFNLYVNKE